MKRMILGLIVIEAMFAGITSDNVQLIRKIDGMNIWKFQDGGNDCYLASYPTTTVGTSISCVKR